MTIKQRYKAFIDYFSEHLPDAQTELLYDSPYQLLVAVILSAQCTDKRVNLTTPALFQKYPTVKALAKATPEDVYEWIKSISYPNNKAKHLVNMAKAVVEHHQGEIPSTFETLISLAGVGRKTANVILSVLHNEPTMAVDTHVFRVSQRIGLVKPSKTPLQVELQLVKHLPKELIHVAHHWIILHGRYVCKAQKPLCSTCEIHYLCKSYPITAI